MELDYFAAIDIGTNAGRVLIGYLIPEGDHMSIKKALLTRVPLRLGEDVFSTGSISESKEQQFLHTMHAFSRLIKAYNVKDYRAVATSAMREAGNAAQIKKRILKETNIDLEIIAGDEEADIIFSTFETQKIDHSKSYLFIDVGGGSTELTIIKKGQRIRSKSFSVGTLRMLNDKVDKNEWKRIDDWLEKHCKNGVTLSGIGTGGNINRIVKLNKKKYLEPMHIKEIKSTVEKIDDMSMQDRIEKLRLKPDRADVIVPAGYIYRRIMDMAEISEILVPKIGLADGIINQLYSKHKNDK